VPVETELLAKEVAKVGARLADPLHALAVDAELDELGDHGWRAFIWARAPDEGHRVLVDEDRIGAGAGLRDRGREQRMRVGLLRCGLQQARRIGEQGRAGLDGADQHATVTDAGIDHHHADRVGELANLGAELVIAPAQTGAVSRQLDGHEHLAGLQRGGVARNDEVLKRQATRALRALEAHAGAQGHERIDPVGRRVCVAQAAAHRAAIAHRAIGDAASHRGQHAAGGVGHQAVLDLGVRDRRAQPQRAGLHHCAAQFGQAAKVYQRIRAEPAAG
jgi:hypothetical protein